MFAVVGSRTFNDYNLLEQTLAKYEIRGIISGGANGADKLAERYAKKYNIPITIYLPDWSVGKCAGAIRNQLIVNDADIVVAFWDGNSKGTKITIDMAIKAKKVVDIIKLIF